MKGETNAYAVINLEKSLNQKKAVLTHLVFREQ